ncbi:alpha/beta fold hydrolase [Antrihabitans sp. YC2-6]|uniref:alpha/beta fold hydrolase n=1 Tax=Antrihabitans sp. YC2-6 TaxID=2799498 RepID=UPI0018F6A393|nr:alpha/beta hydrolase [Antrihabitans sp. YC2-6]MBJ8347410.1 alpha/beta hydrolase [Antrihabitans sp. YC2-6]
MDLTTSTVALAGVNIAYRDSGSPDPVPVVLVHGMGGDGYTWDRFARELVAKGRRVIIPDLRGHGRSAHAPTYLFNDFGADVLRLCDELNLLSADFVGHSLGGYAISEIAQTRPELVRRLVIEECPLPMRVGDPPAQLTGRFPSAPELWHAASSVVRHPRAVLAFDRSMTSSALAQFRKPNPTWWERLPDITAPTLVLRGGKGGMVDPIKLDAMVQAIPDCTVVRFSSGHSIHRDRYSDFEGVVLPFLMSD